MRAFVGLGANLGDRAASLRGALAALRRLSGTRVTGVSSLYETDPVGFVDQPLFYNAAVELDTELGPGELLERMQEIEAAAGRRREGPRFGPRELDLDLLLYGDAVLTEGADRAPQAVRVLEGALEWAMGIRVLPERYRQRLRTTTAQESLNEEIRRRERVIRIFPNRDSIIRLLGALLLEIHEKWTTEPRYLDREEYTTWCAERAAHVPAGTVVAIR